MLMKKYFILLPIDFNFLIIQFKSFVNSQNQKSLTHWTKFACKLHIEPITKNVL